MNCNSRSALFCTVAICAILGTLYVAFKIFCTVSEKPTTLLYEIENEYPMEKPNPNIPIFDKDILSKIPVAKNEVLAEFDNNYIKQDPEEFMNGTELITSKGMPCEQYNAITSDGYYLGMLRIPNPSKKRLPVLLVHGLLSSSDSFLTNLENESLAYILYNKGFDVWLGNVRGNRYSRKHKSLSPSDLKFWDFTFDEMGKYDIPAMVDLVLKETGHSKLNYIGHSQGTTCMFVAGITHDEEFTKKINKFIPLAPAGIVEHMTSPMRYLVPFSEDIEIFYDIFGHGEFLPETGFIDKIAKLMCIHEESLCENILFVFGGSNMTNTNISRVPIYTAHNPAGTSTRNMIHWVQMIKTKGANMKYFDYGSWYQNLYHYGSKSPPTYDFSKFNIPTYSYCGGKDNLVAAKDCYALMKKIKTVKKFTFIRDYTHLDFIWAINAPKIVYSSVIELLY